MRRGAAGKRRDANEPAIIAALRAVGATVEQLSGPNLPDLLVGFCGGNWLFEVKTEKGKLRPNQHLWQDLWHGTVNIVRTPDEALRYIMIQAARK
jgi:hypothetical protein